MSPLGFKLSIPASERLQTVWPLQWAKIFKYCECSHLVGRPALIHITSWPNNEFCLRTVNKNLTNSVPKRLQVNAWKSSRNWFMTGHSTPNAIKVLVYGSYSTFSLVSEHQKPSGSDCSGLSIITTGCWTLSLGRPNKVQNLQVFSMSPGTKCYHIIFMQSSCCSDE
jgi:hypothetical protein